MLASPYAQIAQILLALWSAALVSAFAFGRYNADRTRHSVRPLLMLTSALLVVMAALFWAGAAITPLAGFSVFIAIGMAAAFIGDLILAEYIRTPERVIFGIIAFGAAHILYSLGYLRAADALGFEGGGLRWAILAASWVAGLALWAGLVRSPGMPAVLNLGSLAYTVLISTMTALAVWLALEDRRLWFLALGAALFLASDVILGNQLFRRNNWFLVSDVV